MTDTIRGGPIEVYAELERLADDNAGRLTPEIVWDAAQDPASPFNRFITWDSSEAARRYQLQQCAALIRRFKIVRESGARTIVVPAYVRVLDIENGYRRTGEVITSEFLAQQQRLRLITSMERLAEQLRNWDEFTGVVDAIEAVLEEAG
jgi:hypothetical protein